MSRSLRRFNIIRILKTDENAIMPLDQISSYLHITTQYVKEHHHYNSPVPSMSLSMEGIFIFVDFILISFYSATLLSPLLRDKLSIVFRKDSQYSSTLPIPSLVRLIREDNNIMLSLCLKEVIYWRSKYALECCI